ncbi:MBL fold metallo-hydrolase [Dictyobacter alpinus]|uniref:MBL fold metallo-hydrolase n=1 Tax=Dictyobacter alpinus TaxID=2014873 RepID=A0A402B6N6_9CHLR|nr:MBL fold metallo-hydrolase [Dictyobacter alpinus]GCE27004.1 MBL fold metallo-hydrolase [Dictyobacter alpinus]
MRVVSLGSGSSGNAFLVEAGPQGRTKLLLDAGLSTRMLTTRLASVGVSLAQIQGILVTHEHSDHVQGIPTLLKSQRMPVIADMRTLKAIQEGVRTGVWRTDSGRVVRAKFQDESAVLATMQTTEIVGTTMLLEEGDISVVTPETSTAIKLPHQELPAGSRLKIGDIEITSFAISHDATAPCGFLLQAGGCRVCLVTDSGEVTPTMLEHMQHADLLILESNHDRERLWRGPYPWHLKHRIISATGHLSNDQAGEAVLKIWRERGMRWLWLAHLSRTNNTPGLALESMRLYLRAAHVNLAYIKIVALPPTLGQIWDSTQLWQ